MSLSFQLRALLQSMNITTVALLFGMALSSSSLPAQQIEFVEAFVLSENREAELAKLVPGTEPYYYYNALHLQLSEKYQQVDELLKTWIDRYGYTAGVNEIRTRQALLKYQQSPRESLDFLNAKLNLLFDHQREIPATEQNLPSELNEALIDSKTLLDRALSISQLTDQVEHAGMNKLAERFDNLSVHQKHHFLQRLTYPDIPKLVERIVADMQSEFATPFGSLPIHQLLTLEQMKQLAVSKPDLLNNETFIQLYCRKLRPSDDVELLYDPAAMHDYLLELWKFVEPLDPSQNSIKANVMFNLLRNEQHLGKWDLEHFKAYLALPRDIFYINPVLMKQRKSVEHTANLYADFSSPLRMPIVGDEQPLVIDYLHHFLLDANSPNEFAKFFEDTFLQKQFATVKILNGLGDVEKWARILNPSEYKALVDRVDIEFVPTNPMSYLASDIVKLNVDIKNVKDLIVKVFEINSENFYRQFGRNINTDIKLDGLVPNWQQTHSFNDPPAIRKRHEFTFPELDHRGVFVIDFIGNGQSSRALINKGRLTSVSQITSTGQAVTVYDESGNQLKDASLWIGGRVFEASEDGQIDVPFSTQPAAEIAILRHKEFAALATIQQQAENYQLSAGFFVDREMLLRSRKAKLLVRPALKVAGTPTPMTGLLEKTQLTVTSVNHDGKRASKVFRDLKLTEANEFACEFQVPPRLATLEFSLTAEIKNISRNETDNLMATGSLSINQIDKSDEIQDVFLVLSGDDYFLEVRGMSGEPRPKQIVQVHLKHRMVLEQISQTMQADKSGRVKLGPLSEIVGIRANVAGNSERGWDLSRDSQQTRYSAKTAIVGESVYFAAPHYMNVLDRSLIGLYELRDGVTRNDLFENIDLKDGMITIKDLPAGNFRLVFKPTNEELSIVVTEGNSVGSLLHGRHRSLERREVVPIVFKNLESNNDEVRLFIGNSRPTTRVHVIATRFVPRFNAFDWLNVTQDLEPAMYKHGMEFNSFTSGRKIGDEYRYILDRQFAQKFPGNMLDRPSLLLRPWSLGPTENREQALESSGDFGQAANPAPAAVSRPTGSVGGSELRGDFSNLDFLSDGAIVIDNLPVDENGVVKIDRKKLGDKTRLTFVVTDLFATMQRTAAFSVKDPAIRDLRLLTALEAAEHVSQQKQIEIVSANEPFKINDILTARFQTYNDLTDVFRLFESINPGAGLNEWRFLLSWAETKEEAKQDLYSKHTCHELNFYLWKKDRAFFDKVVRPFLENKFQKTFVDHWLLDEDLKRYTEPWAFERLNSFEKTLLALRLEDQQAEILRHLSDQFALLPLDQARRDSLFDAALASEKLDENEELLGRMEKANSDLSKNMPSITRDAEDKSADGSLAGEESLSFKQAPGAPGGGGGGLGGAGAGGGRASRALADRKSLGRAKLKEAAKDEVAQIQTAESELRAHNEFDARKADNFFAGKEVLRRQLGEKFYQQVKPTEEWVESNFYHVRPETPTAGLVSVNRFWMDWAQHKNNGPFLSQYFAEATGNLNEMLLALAVLDLPGNSADPDAEFADRSLQLKSKNAAIMFHQQIRPAIFDQRNTTILVSENFFQKDDRYRMENNLQFDKFVEGKVSTHTLYGGQVVVTNPTSTPRIVELLVQIPAGALATSGSQETRALQFQLPAFNSQSFEYYFYFPAAGSYTHFPAHVTEGNFVLATSAEHPFEVTDEPRPADTKSWAYVSQNGTDTDVLDMLKTENLMRLDLAKIAFRMKDEKFYGQVIKVLRNRHAYNHVLWSYSLKHNQADSIKEFLAQEDSIVRSVGTFLKSPLLDVDAVARRWYEQHEFWPLVNIRAHQIRKDREILNSRIHQQYHQLLQMLSYRPALDNNDQLAIVYYLLLQDRVAESLKRFSLIDPKQINSQLQYDYLNAYINMYQSNPEKAQEIATKYTSYSVPEWRNRFAAISAQVAELRGEKTSVVDPENEAAAQTKLADRAPSFEFKVEKNQIVLDHQNLEKVDIHYYLMDAELLFSSNPFDSINQNGFSLIRPNATVSIPLNQEKKHQVIDLPAEFTNKNVLVEIRGGDQTKAQPFYANGLTVQVIESFGQVKVTAAGDGRLLPKTYVKVYAANEDGSSKFYKDGYTDLRGRFDYATQSNISMSGITKFALLIQNEELGTVIRQVDVPKQ